MAVPRRDAVIRRHPMAPPLAARRRSGDTFFRCLHRPINSRPRPSARPNPGPFPSPVPKRRRRRNASPRHRLTLRGRGARFGRRIRTPRGRQCTTSGFRPDRGASSVPSLAQTHTISSSIHRHVRPAASTATNRNSARSTGLGGVVGILGWPFRFLLLPSPAPAILPRRHRNHDATGTGAGSTGHRSGAPCTWPTPDIPDRPSAAPPATTGTRGARPRIGWRGGARGQGRGPPGGADAPALTACAVRAVGRASEQSTLGGTS